MSLFINHNQHCLHENLGTHTVNLAGTALREQSTPRLKQQEQGPQYQLPKQEQAWCIPPPLEGGL